MSYESIPTIAEVYAKKSGDYTNSIFELLSTMSSILNNHIIEPSAAMYMASRMHEELKRHPEVISSMSVNRYMKDVISAGLGGQSNMQYRFDDYLKPLSDD